MGTSGQTLQEQDKLFLRKSMLQNVSAITIYTTWYRAYDVTQLLTFQTKATSDAAVTRNFPWLSLLCFYLCLLVTTRASPSRYIPRGIYRGCTVDPVY
jgi:hypothetical protein